MRAGIAAALAAALLTGCGAAEPPATPGAPPVMVARAEARDVTDRIEATGQLLARAEATVAAQVGGEITGIAADEGQPVELGQVVVEIDPERRELELADARANVVQSRSQVAEAQREAARHEKLAGRGVASQARVDEAKTRLAMARSGLAAAQARSGLSERALRDASVTAPFAGLVGRRHVNAGEYVNAGDPLFDLVALDPIEVEFHLSEVDSARVAVGQSVEVRVAPFPDETFSARVTVVAPTIERETRTRRVKALLDNREGRLLPGTFAKVDLGVAERSGVVTIPKEAVLQRSDGSVLYRLVGTDRVERLVVETGIHLDERIEVRGRVAAGDWIVVRGQSGLVDGAPVSLRGADGTVLDAAALGTRAAGERSGG